ncbi:putative P-loop containing nucleoside triphosphate hydrolase, leucine-rich repeat domain, L [Rosa chinensis]|uniref:Putative P-loop containing nucleoside triphosphate hydrolase, leucine-rich repeat domain, L n=1 Tax=Rosa chinensis TaxID=74649 RepID=A0A2P6PRR2_ROSCH|nr:disease resistance protein RPM1 [Rosa chinensis]XP_024162311.1 disease resistance protein RPM1 [Rosa chinensis]XP_040364964.1 disease resistance protein RPM1 [Rosa chinensis]XP_040364965.1 disease resistance protein RPM1 [Rosa chinensis]XP_040364966.1 disease resistance protein RPM1 [Rosa chinensis]PRQ24617.1 putative P-loop containing nucleoside triphosphate hydrolase, leucine-rich repeat domain, L [Rosa chinensis]
MASPAIDLLIGKIVSFLESEVSLLEGVHDELHEVKLELLTMKAFLEDAERKGALSEVEKTWVANVRDVSIDVEDIIDEFTYDTNKRRSWGPFTRAFWKTLCLPQNIWERHRIATKLQTIIKTIKDIPERNRRYGSVRIEGSTSHHDVNRIKVYGESSLFLKDDDLVGITDARRKLVGWLLSSHSQRTVISVVGMGGSGKTTLVASTFNNQTVQQHFGCYTWITVSQSYTVEDLFRVMINELLAAAQMDVPQNLSNMSYRHLVEMLVHYLQPRRYMIVLDDVWDTNLWRSIDVALPNGTHGSRIMLTTRNKDIASLAFGVESHVHQVEPLNTNEAWDLFSRRAFSGGSDKSCPPELQIIARELVGKCEGLPLGLVALGSLMSTKRFVSEWKKVYNSMSWELSNNPTLEVVKSILLLSFNDLPYRLKHCFLYFCIFPEDYTIKCKRLVRLWIAEGFVEQVRGGQPEEIAESYLAELTCRCMLQVVEREPSGKAKKFKMHDLLRELAISISEAEKFCTVYNEKETNEERQAPRRLSIQGSSGKVRAHKDMTNVRSLFVLAPKMMASSSSLEKVLPSGFKLLRVLDLKYVPIQELPDEIMKCFNLTSLNLKGTEVRKLPKRIGNLQNLETMDIRDSNIRELPVGIVKLQKLRHLFMYHFNYGAYKSFNSFQGTKAPAGICKLQSLQILDSIEAGSELIKQLQHMTQLTALGLANVKEADEIDLCKSIESMKLMECLTVKTSSVDEVLRMDALLLAPPLLKTLVLTGKLNKVPLWFASLESLTVLYLHWSRSTEDFLPHIHALPNLTKLWLCNAYVGNQLLFQTGFQKLSGLYITNFPQLNLITIEKGVMPALKTLDISECMELKRLPRGIKLLTCLQKLHLHRVPNELVERMRRKRGVDHSKVKHISDIRLFH